MGFHRGVTSSVSGDATPSCDWPSVAEQQFHDHHVEPSAELPADFAFVAHDLEAVRGVQPDRGLMATDDAGEHRMESVRRGPFGEVAEQHPADAAAMVVAVDVHRVLDAGRVRGARPVGRQRGETDYGARGLGDGDHVRAGAVGDPGGLVGRRSLDDVEGDGRRANLDVVDAPNGLAVVDGGESYLHGSDGTRATRRLDAPCGVPRLRAGRWPVGTGGAVRRMVVGPALPGGYSRGSSRRQRAVRAPLAQSAERFHGKEKVVSSILTGGSSAQSSEGDRPDGSVRTAVA